MNENNFFDSTDANFNRAFENALFYYGLENDVEVTPDSHNDAFSYVTLGSGADTHIFHASNRFFADTELTFGIPLFGYAE